MPRTNLTDTRVRALKPRKTHYDIRDGKLGGFGIRVLTSGGKQFFVHCQHRGERVWKIVGDAETLNVKEARSRAAEMLASIRRDGTVPPRPEETLFEAVARTVFERHERIWKPRTLKVNEYYLKNQLLPHFAGRPIADIDRREVRDWFAALHATPVAADRSMPVLSVIMREAEAMGLPAGGLQPVPGRPAIPPQGARALPVRRGGPLAVRDTVGACRTGSAPCRDRPPSPADRLPEGRSPDAALVGLSRGPSLSAGLQDRPPHRLAVRTGPEHSRRSGAQGPVGVSRAPVPADPATRAGWNGSGARCAPRPICPTSGFMTCGIRMPASPCGREKPSSPSPGCSAMPILRPP